MERITPSEAELTEYVIKQTKTYLPRKFQLEITEDCTLRCKYCFFTNEDFEKRKHNGLNMSDEVAYKAIDYYFNVYTDVFKALDSEQQKKILQIAPPNLNWWGGEPFLNFDLMRKTKKIF